MKESCANGGKLASFGLCGLVFAVMLAGNSCRKEGAQSQSDGAGEASAVPEKIAEADRLYAQREDLGKVRQAIALLRQARTSDYGNYEVAWKLAKLDYYLGEHTMDDRERDDAFREGTEAGQAAVSRQPDKPDGHFWLGANYGGSAEHSTLAGLSNVEDIRREMESVLKIDESFQAGSAHMVLGQLYLQAPRLLGGDAGKAVDSLEKGLKYGSNNALLRVHLAEAYHAVNRDQDARRQIGVLMSMKPDPDYLPEHKEAIARAKKLLDKIR
jgi:tetratricopeptide (TPR) repeat protein